VRFRDFYADLTIHARPDAPRNPAVSVILPTYARAHGPLQRAIDSVLSQSFEDFELIVVDDGSRDGTEDVLADYQHRDPRVVIHRFHGNSGLPALRVNQGILASKGRYIAYQFDDDVWMPDSLKVRVEEISSHSRPVVVYGVADLEQILGNGETRLVRLGAPFNFMHLRDTNFIANNTVLHSRETIDVAGMYDPHIILRRYSDYDLWVRMARHFDFIWIDHKVSHVNVLLENSLGQTVHLDSRLRDLLVGVPRDHLLTPGTISDYDPHSLSPYRHLLSGDEIFRISKAEISQFLSAPFDYFDEVAWRESTTSRRKARRISCIAPENSASVEICVRRFCNLMPNTFSFIYTPEEIAPHADFSTSDTDIFFRTRLPKTTKLIRKAQGKRPVIYASDDNLLKLYQLGNEFEEFTPSSPVYHSIVEQIRTADINAVYSPISYRDFSALNRHTLLMETNLPRPLLEKRSYQRLDRVKYAILTNAHRKDIISQIWPALHAFASRRRREVEFEFWGVEPNFKPSLPCPVSHRPFDTSYERYLRSLSESSIDVVLIPLDGHTDAAQSKCSAKFGEAIVSGAVCIFSDTPPYSDLPPGSCLKTENTVVAWDAALEQSFLLGQSGRDEMLERARGVALNRFSTEEQAYDFLALIDAAMLHSRLKGHSILFIFHECALGGATLHLLKHAGLMRSMGFDILGLVPDVSVSMKRFEQRWRMATDNAPLIAGRWHTGYVEKDDYFAHRQISSDDEKASQILARQMSGFDIGLVHAATWQPVATRLAKRLNVPCVYSLHAFYETPAGALTNIADAVHCSSSRYARVWEKEIGAPARRIVCPVDDELFRMHEKNRNRPVNRPVRILVSGTLQPRKNQIEAIRAVKKLVADGHDVELDLIGYSQLHSSYSDECLAEVENGLAARVRLHDFVDDVKRFYDHHADILLMASTDESMPQVILQAMAAGVLVVSTDVGGVTELIKHRYSGVIARGPAAQDLAEALSYALSLTPEQRREIIDRAFRVISCLGKSTYVRAELIDLYNQACEVHAARNPDAVRDLTDILNTARPAAPAIPQPQEAAPAAIRIETISAHDPVQPDGTFWQKRHFEIAAPGDTVSGFSITIAAEGDYRRHLRIRIGAAVRPDIVLRVAELSLPADGTPKQVSVRFAPISVVKGQALRVEIEAEDGDVLAYRPAGDGASTVALLDEPHRA